MAKVVCKGTAIQIEIASVFTAIGQVISTDGPEAVPETAEVDTLDNTDSGIPYMSTGRVEGGSISGELFLDPVLATHTAITDLLTTPAETNAKLLFADVAVTEWPMVFAAGPSLGPRVALPEGLKASFAAKLTKLPTYP